MVESSKGTHRIQGCGATFVSPTAGSPQIDGRIRQPTVIGPDHVQRDTVLDAVNRGQADNGQQTGLGTIFDRKRPALARGKSLDDRAAVKVASSARTSTC